MEVLVNSILTIVPFLVVIAVVVTFHEFGHYFAARLCNLPVSVFSIGFGQPLWKKTDRNGTEWRLSPILIGGYVKIPNLLTLPGPKDSFVDNENVAGAEIPVRKKFIAVAGGPLASFILAIIVFALVITFQGFVKEPLVVKSIYNLPVSGFELQQDDEILAINEEPINTLYDLYIYGNQSDPADTFYYKVRRFEEVREVTGPYPTPPIIDNINLASPAEKAGLRVGDVVLRVDGREVGRGSDLAREVTDSKGQLMDLVVFRDNQEINITLAG
ncbi:MAG: site-2 protease family protein, partial [Paracoccaceae bacterium]|nr:site-2 protease family protein [Paracoccaceae bacterium]